MTRERADGPLFSTAYLAGLLAGEAHCRWASWFRGHHEDWNRPKLPGFSRDEWEIDYTQRLNNCIKRYEEQGYTVSNGGPNDYVIGVSGALLEGRPDVIATKGDDCVVIDFPDSGPNGSNTLQVMTHMYALPRAVERLQGTSPRGELVYRREVVDVPAASVDHQFIGNLTALVELLALEEPPPRIPSQEECARCDISGPDCPDRLDDTRSFRLPDPPGHEAYYAMLERAEWAEADRDREYAVRLRAGLRIRELEEEIRRLSGS